MNEMNAIVTSKWTGWLSATPRTRIRRLLAVCARPLAPFDNLRSIAACHEGARAADIGARIGPLPDESGPCSGELAVGIGTGIPIAAFLAEVTPPDEGGAFMMSNGGDASIIPAEIEEGRLICCF